MPDPIIILSAMAAAAAVAGVVLLLFGWPWGASGRRSQGPSHIASAGAVVGVGLGFAAGCWLLGTRTHWPPREDQDRFLLILLPAIIGVEVVAVFAGRAPKFMWPLRLIIAAFAGRILLHNTSFITDLAGPGSREWTPAQSVAILGAMATALVGVWILLLVLANRTPARPALAPESGDMPKGGRSVVMAVAIACGGAAITIMLSGYASGGQIGLPLAAALAGATLASLVLSKPSNLNGVLGVGVVGLFGLLVMGRLFGQLTTANAALLVFAPLLSWLPEAPLGRRLGTRLRAATRVILTAVPVIAALVLAQQKFVEESASSSAGSREPSIQDYMDFGK